MKTIFLAGLSFIFISCKKDKGPPSLDSDNQVKAAIVLSAGDTIKINAIGSKAPMGCSIGHSFVDGTNDANAAIYIQVDVSGQCITNPGIYDLYCEYRPDATSQTMPIYVNQGVAHPGSITFTTLNNNYAEGYFDAVCKSGGDSVIVTGSFQGHWD